MLGSTSDETGLLANAATCNNRGDPVQVSGQLQGTITRHYAGWENGGEVALISLDIYDRREFPDVDYLVIYELYVPEGLRNKGIGTRALQAAEQFGKNLRFRKTLLHAKPLFETRTQAEMIAWYQRRGYVQVEGQPSDLEKIL